MKVWNAILAVILTLALGCSPKSQNSNSTAQPAPTPQHQPSGEAPVDSGPKIFRGSPVDVEVGDWDSYGSPVMPPEPILTAFRYKCSAFLQDQLERKARMCEDCEEHNYRLFRLYEFEISNENNSVNFDNLNYKRIAYFSIYSDMQQLTYEVEEDLQLETPKAQLFFELIDDYRFDPPKRIMQIRSTIGQAFGEKTVYKSETHDKSPDYGLQLELFMSVRNTDPENKQPVPAMLLEVKCEKQL